MSRSLIVPAAFAGQMVLTGRILILLLSAAVPVAALTLPLSAGGWFLAIGQCALVFGLLFPKTRILYTSATIVLALVLLSLPWIQRRNLPIGPRSGALLRLPQAAASSAINQLISEEDGVYLAARMLSLLQGITPAESEGFIPALVRGYDRMRTKRGAFATPLISTVLGLETAQNFDLLEFGSETKPNSDTAVIFLHGTGGNWSLLCYLISEAAEPLGIDTACPSIGLLGIWGSSQGRAVLRQTITTLKQRGKKHLILAGLSAGAIGAGEIYQEYSADFAGLVLLFGAHPATDKVQAPTLYIYSRNDERIPQRWVSSFAADQRKRNNEVEVHALMGDHFLIAKRATEVQEILRPWLEQQQKKCSPVIP